MTSGQINKKALIPDLEGSETVLLAEDDEMVRDLVSSILCNQGYTVLVGKNGQQALAALDCHEGPIDLVLTDVDMPDMNGQQLFEQISVSCPGARVLYMSACAQNAIEQEVKAEIDGRFIRKPFSVRKLASKIREVLG